MSTKLPYLLAMAIIGSAGCATSNRGNRWQQGTTTINVSGPPSAPFTGFYLCDGQRFEFSSAVPFTFAVEGLSEAEIRKANSGDSLTVEAHFRGEEMHLNFSTTAGPTVPGVRIQVRNGLSVENLKQ